MWHDHQEQLAPVGGRPTGNGIDAEDHTLTVAWAYARQGLKIIPLDGKKHAIKEGLNHYNASSDPTQIRAWWTEHTGANIGLARRALPR